MSDAGDKRSATAGQLDGQNLINDLQKAIREEKIKLPAMPDIAIRIREAFKDEQYDIMHIAHIVQADTGLAAYTLKIANSPLHRGPIPITTAKHAICRLGQQSVQNLVLIYTVRSLFETKSSKLKNLLSQQWQLSTGIAAISAILSRRCEDFDPDKALLAGLLQDIGNLPLINWLKDQEIENEDMDVQFEALSARFSVKIGLMIMQAWQFADELIEVVKSREDWSRDSGPGVDTADIVNIARYHYYMSSGKKASLPAITKIAAYHKLPFKKLTPDQSLQIIEESRDDIEEIKSMLR